MSLQFSVVLEHLLEGQREPSQQGKRVIDLRQEGKKWILLYRSIHIFGFVLLGVGKEGMGRDKLEMTLCRRNGTAL